MDNHINMPSSQTSTLYLRHLQSVWFGSTLDGRSSFPSPAVFTCNKLITLPAVTGHTSRFPQHSPSRSQLAVLTLRKRQRSFSSQLFQQTAHNDHIISHSMPDNLSIWNSVTKERKRTCSLKTEPCRILVEGASWSNRRKLTSLGFLVGAYEQQRAACLLALLLPLKMEVLRSSKIWVNLHETVGCYTPEK
jgi:hypothetical protein